MPPRKKRNSGKGGGNGTTRGSRKGGGQGHGQRPMMLPTSMVSCVLGLNPRKAPYRTVACILAKQHGLLDGDLVAHVFDHHPSLPAGLLDQLGSRLAGFDLEMFHQLVDQLDALPADTVAVDDDWENQLSVIRAALGVPEDGAFMLELFLAMYCVNKQWECKAASMPDTHEGMAAMHAAQAEEEDRAHAEAVATVEQASETAANMLSCTKQKVKFRALERCRGTRWCYALASRADGMFQIGSPVIDVISDSKGCSDPTDDAFLQILLYTYAYNSSHSGRQKQPRTPGAVEFGFVVRSCVTHSGLLAIQLESHSEYIEQQLLAPLDALFEGLANKPVDTVREFYSPNTRSRRFLEHLVGCAPPDLTALGPTFVELHATSASSCVSPPIDPFKEQWVQLPGIESQAERERMTSLVLQARFAKFNVWSVQKDPSHSYVDSSDGAHGCGPLLVENDGLLYHGGRNYGPKSTGDKWEHMFFVYTGGLSGVPNRWWDTVLEPAVFCTHHEPLGEAHTGTLQAHTAYKCLGHEPIAR